MENKISNVHLNFTCKQNWDAMQDTAHGKFCNQCQKTVYDLTDKDAIFLRKIMAENPNSICGRFSADQLASPATHKPYWKKWVSAIMMFIGLGTLAERAKAQEKSPYKLPDSLKVEQKCDTTESTIFGGVSETPPEFRGGTRAFNRFIADNLVIPPKTPKGKVQVSFTIEKDGSLNDIKILKGLTKAANKEAIRVLSLCPKWLPGVQNGRYISVTYTFFITFNTDETQQEYLSIIR